MTDDQVREIYASCESQKVLAERFGTHQPVISDIKNLKTWEHLDLGVLPPGQSVMCKLTENQVREIYESVEPQRVLAKQFGVSMATISHIKCLKTWRHLNLGVAIPGRGDREGPCAKLTEDQVRNIYASKEKSILLAERFGVSVGLVSNIKNLRAWQHLNLGVLPPGTSYRRRKVSERCYDAIVASDLGVDELANHYCVSGWLVGRIKAGVPWEFLSTKPMTF